MIDRWIDELEHDLGQAAALRLLANAGGQRREIPKTLARSRLSQELGADVAAWLCERFGGMAVDIPSLHGRQRQDSASQLRAAILEAGLTDPTRSANDIATEHGVTAAWVHKLRSQMRADLAQGDQMQLPLIP